MGDITTFLDLNPSFDTAYVINNLERIDEGFLLSTLEKYNNSSLYVLADPPDLEQAEVITSDNITTLINVLRNVFLISSLIQRQVLMVKQLQHSIIQI